MAIFSFIGHTLLELFGKTGNWLQIHKQTSLNFYTSNDAYLQKRYLEEKILNAWYLATSLLIILKKCVVHTFASSYYQGCWT